ncbi:hypothetical protein SAMN05421505_104246 [Sinosporangium album]|uniref:Uncharacterized protein n=1 Tax=Sinosporangium album TaxID=504805 RepID=A0A1G7UG87_9ACTN|nr:hypothetical protein [Sinosporangium album]SDG46477.1 hypothetical protein SAMN05421505_104246 [Sinosporangium album]
MAPELHYQLILVRAEELRAQAARHHTVREAECVRTGRGVAVRRRSLFGKLANL